MTQAPNMIQFMNDTKAKMDKSLEATSREFSNLRTGRASVHLVENIQVNYYNTPTPLKQLATISTPDAKSLAIAPWDNSQIKSIETAIQKSDLGLSPVNDGKVIRIQVPMLTSERRAEIAKLAKKVAEEGKISIRSARHDAIEKIKKWEKDKSLPEDDSEKFQKNVQNVTNEHIKKIDEAVEKKEKEITEI